MKNPLLRASPKMFSEHSTSCSSFGFWAWLCEQISVYFDVRTNQSAIMQASSASLIKTQSTYLIMFYVVLENLLFVQPRLFILKERLSYVCKST